MKKIFRNPAAMLFSGMLVLASASYAKPQSKEILHEVQEDETAWFLAQLYYGSGAQYPQILKANSFTRAEDIKAGLKIRIENAKYSPEQNDFPERKKSLWLKRQKALGLNRPDKVSGLFLPTEEIRKKDRAKDPENE